MKEGGRGGSERKDWKSDQILISIFTIIATRFHKRKKRKKERKRKRKKFVLQNTFQRHFLSFRNGVRQHHTNNTNNTDTHHPTTQHSTLPEGRGAREGEWGRRGRRAIGCYCITTLIQESANSETHPSLTLVKKEREREEREREREREKREKRKKSVEIEQKRLRGNI